MSGAEPPVGATRGSSAADLPPPPPPPPQQQQQKQEITTAQLSAAILEIIRLQKQQQEMTAAARSRSQSDELRGWLMLVATLTASVTYSAALNPPGGVWQADDPANGYIAGRPVLLDKFVYQYFAFHYFSVTSFAISLLIILLSSTPSLYNRVERRTFSNLVGMDISALAGAFIAGSWTAPKWFVYDIMAISGVLVCIVSFRKWVAPIKYTE